MTSERILRSMVGLAGMIFAGLAVSIWAAPEYAARIVGVEAVRAAGTAMLRSDLGGLFAGIAVLCGMAAWTARQSWTAAATTMLSAIVTGRTLGWISAGRIGGDLTEMAVELALIATLVAYWRHATRVHADRTLASVHAGGRTGAVHRRRIAMTAAWLLVPVSGAAALLTPGVQQRIYNAGAGRKAATINTAPLVDDALRVAVCGSSAPLPSAARAKACVAVFAGGKFYIVDSGPESVESLMLWGIPMSSIGGVLLTHFHSDHIGDLGELNLQTWVGGRRGPLQVYGGPGVERVVVGFGDAYRLDQGYRTRHHGEQVMSSETWPMVARTITFHEPATPAKDRTAMVLDEGGLRITAIEVDHAPIWPAYAYRFDYKGRSALITGDLKEHSPLAKAARGVDVIVSEAIAVSMTRALGEGARTAGRSNTAAVMHDIEDYHITPEQAAAIANDAGAKLLAFYHLLPAPDGALARRVFGRGVDGVRKGDWTIADDGSVYTMPIGSDVVHIDRMIE